METSSGIEVRHPPRERWGSALNLALSHRSPAERIQLTELLLKPRTHEPPGAGFAGLLEAATADGALLGAALAVLQPGQTAMVFQPRILGDNAEVRDKLYAGLDHFLRKNEVCLAQEVLLLDAEADAKHAANHGYSINLELVYLSADTAKSLSIPPNNQIFFEPFRDSELARLAALLDQTFIDTLDCPEVNGIRSSINTLVGYREIGVFSPLNWQFLQFQGGDVGCVLLARHNDAAAELIYLGLIPSVRGRGLGKHLIAQTLSIAQQANCASLSVAVDARNLPALRSYAGCGFEEFDRRRVMLRSYAGNRESVTKRNT